MTMFIRTRASHAAMLAMAVTTLTLGACKKPTADDGGAPGPTGNAAASAAAAAGTGSAQGFPPGFSAMPGARDLAVQSAGPKYPNGKIVSFAIAAKTDDVGAYYRAIVDRLGMTVNGTAISNDMYSITATKPGGDPKSVSITAIDKGEFTNVSMMFNVTG